MFCKNVQSNKTIAKKYNAYNAYYKYNTISKIHGIPISTIIIFEEYMNFFKLIKIPNLMCHDDEFVLKMACMFKRKYGIGCFNALYYIVSKTINCVEIMENIIEIFKNDDSERFNFNVDENYIYNVAKVVKPYLCKTFLTKKFNLNKHNILSTLAKIAGDQILVICAEQFDKNNKHDPNYRYKPIIYIYNGYLWSNENCDFLLIDIIQNKLYNYYKTEAARVGYDNLEKFDVLLDKTFCNKLINSIKRIQTIGRLNYNIRFDNLNNIFNFNNISFNLYENKFVNTTCDDFVSSTCGYNYVIPSLNKINKLNEIIKIIMPVEHKRITMLNLCCASLFDKELDIIAIMKEECNNSGMQLILTLLKNVLGNYHVVCDNKYIKNSKHKFNTITDKQVIIFENYDSIINPIDSDAINKIVNRYDRRGPVFIFTNTRPKFNKSFSFAFAKKIVEISFKSKVDIEWLKKNNDDYTSSYFYILVNHIFDSNNYKICSNSTKWYINNIDIMVKKKVRKYNEYNKSRLDKFFVNLR